MTVEAVRLACRYMTPVLVLSDMFLSSAAEPWRAPDSAELPKITAPVAADGPYLPYGRDAKLARPWAAAGTTGREYRTGGLEKEANTGNVSYDSANHEEMVRLRAEKIAGIAADIPELTVQGPTDGELLVVGWGSTAALLAAAVRRGAKRGRAVAHAQFRYLNPLPRNTGDVLRRYRRVLVAELNRGQLRTLLRDRYLIDAMGFNRMMGRPFLVSEVEEKIENLLDRPPSSYYA
jgi:2-oxoglutarate ferredoxin oxidoreductase subunit alpha